MSSEKFDDIFDQCLSMLEAGASIDDCIAPYPEHAEALEAQLRTVEMLRRARPQVQPQPSAQAQNRARLLAAVAEQRQVAEAQPAPGMLAPFQALFDGTRRLALLPRAVPVLVAILALSAAAVGVSAATGQGPLGALLTTDSGPRQTELHGAVTAIDCAAGTVMIDDATVRITGDTDLHGLSCEDIEIGMLLTVEATEDDGILTAREIQAADAGAKDADGPPAGDDVGKEDGAPDSGTGQDTHGDDDTPAGAADDDGDDDHDRSGPGDDEGHGAGDDDDDSGPGDDDHDGTSDDEGGSETGDGDGDGDHDRSGPGDDEDHGDDDDGAHSDGGDEGDGDGDDGHDGNGDDDEGDSTDGDNTVNDDSEGSDDHEPGDRQEKDGAHDGDEAEEGGSGHSDEQDKGSDGEGD